MYGGGWENLCTLPIIALCLIPAPFLSFGGSGIRTTNQPQVLRPIDVKNDKNLACGFVMFLLCIPFLWISVYYLAYLHIFLRLYRFISPLLLWYFVCESVSMCISCFLILVGRIVILISFVTFHCQCVVFTSPPTYIRSGTLGEPHLPPYILSSQRGPNTQASHISLSCLREIASLFDQNWIRFRKRILPVRAWRCSSAYLLRGLFNSMMLQENICYKNILRHVISTVCRIDNKNSYWDKLIIVIVNSSISDG